MRSVSLKPFAMFNGTFSVIQVVHGTTSTYDPSDMYSIIMYA